MELIDKQSALSTQQIIAFSLSAAATAAVIAVTTYVFLSRKTVVDPGQILARCQDAINSIEKELQSTT